MTAKKIEEKIKQLHSIESKARILQEKMDGLSTKWENLNEDIRGTNTWKEHCAKMGLSTNYNFGDILC